MAIVFVLVWVLGHSNGTRSAITAFRIRGNVKMVDEFKVHSEQEQDSDTFNSGKFAVVDVSR